MKIFIGHNRYQYKGGEDVVAASEQKILKEQGQDVIFYEKDNRTLLSLPPWKKALAYLSVDWSKESYREVRAILKKERPDIAHFHNVHIMMTPSVYYACQDEGVPVGEEDRLAEEERRPEEFAHLRGVVADLRFGFYSKEPVLVKITECAPVVGAALRDLEDERHVLVRGKDGDGFIDSEKIFAVLREARGTP